MLKKMNLKTFNKKKLTFEMFEFPLTIKNSQKSLEKTEKLKIILSKTFEK